MFLPILQLFQRIKKDFEYRKYKYFSYLILKGRLEDLSENKNSNSSEHEQKDIMRILLRISENIIHIPAGRIDYQAITDSMMELSGAWAVALNIYDFDNSVTTTMAVSGISPAIKKASDILGFNLTGKSWELKTDRLRRMKGGKLVHFESLYETSMGALSKSTSDTLHQIFRLGDIYVVELAYGNQKPLGDLIFIMQAGRRIKNNDAIEIYAGLFSSLQIRKQTEIALKESEARNSALISAIPDMMFRFNSKGVYLDAEIKNSVLLYEKARHAYSSGELAGKHLTDMLPPEIASSIQEKITMAIETGSLQVLQYSYPINNALYYFEARLASTGPGEVVSIVRDITEIKLYESRLQYLSMHDALTGLYNRAYFENELYRLEGSREYPIVILAADLDGLKMINDVLGHKKGDLYLQRCAALMMENLRRSDVLARIGGDEFAVLMPRAAKEDGEAVISRIRQSFDQYNSEAGGMPLSISIGLACSESCSQSLEETLKKADSAMYKDKLIRSYNLKERIVDTVINELVENNYINPEQIKERQELSIKLGRAVGLEENRLSDLSRLAEVCNLGLIGIPRNVFEKKESLSEDEKALFRQHPEKGYRIALASTGLSHLADLILRHHENWDGSGYPLGLKGKEIPIECRILRIADDFTSMTSGEAGTPEMTVEKAAAAIRKKTTQIYDPELVETFITML